MAEQVPCCICGKPAALDEALREYRCNACNIYLPRCPTCGAFAAYIKEYRKFYCNACRFYVPGHPPKRMNEGARKPYHPEIVNVATTTPRCTKCGKALEYMTEYNRYYCRRCQEYQ